MLVVSDLIFKYMNTVKFYVTEIIDSKSVAWYSEE